VWTDAWPFIGLPALDECFALDVAHPTIVFPWMSQYLKDYGLTVKYVERTSEEVWLEPFVSQNSIGFVN
jgi:hypothetical protein